MVESVYDRINDYGSVKVMLASPNDIRSWSFGEVRRPETINYRTYRPEKEGLFCERIFGPERDWECSCGKYKGTKHKGIICDRCGVKVTHSRVRRKRMGHISLAAPIVHIWYFKALPSRLGTLLGMKTSDLEKVILFQDYVVIDPGQTPLKYQQVLTEDEYRQATESYGSDFQASIGAEAIKVLLEKLELSELAMELRDGLTKTSSKQKIKDITKRLKLVESIRTSGNDPEWMVMDVVPVIPPDLRPLVLLESGNFATSDLNDLYRRIINRNNRLKKLMDLNAPGVIIRNEKRMLQQAVDGLFDNSRCRRPVQGTANRPLKSLTDMIKGKQGRFRENLLGKRVDYSARSVIVVGPELKLHQCGLPKKIALELYQPFIIRCLKDRGLADTIKSAKRMLERRDREIWDVLEEVIYQHPVMLNRAPTLHRMGIQAFEPILVEGNAIKIHPLVCKGFNADFDGDQMAVHLPLSVEAQAETHVLMLATNNIFSPASGSPIVSPMQDIVLGVYYLTTNQGAEFVTDSVLTMECEDGDKRPVYATPAAAITAYTLGRVGMHAEIVLKVDRDTEIIEDDKIYTASDGKIVTTAGRCIFNDVLPEGMGFYNYPLGQKGAARVIRDCYVRLGRGDTLLLLDLMKALGFKYSTVAGTSFGITDAKIPGDKAKIIDAAQKRVDRIEDDFHNDAITDGERYNQVVDVWIHAREEVTKSMMTDLKSDRRVNDPNYINPVYMMLASAARGNVDQIRQLAGMRGLMSKPSGEIIETPIRANFREGLTVLEYFSSTHGARKGLADTALKTADSGYLTRKLADVAQNVIVNSIDCGTLKGISKSATYKGEQVDVPLRDVIIGRVARENIINPITDELIVKESRIITREMALKIEDLGLETIQVRSPLTCDSPLGICARCYGVDLATSELVEEGNAVGIIAAQSIGEPGTQLTMRTFHTGGVATRAVVETEINATVAGTVKFNELNAVAIGSGKDASVIVLKRNGEISIHDEKGRELDKYKIPYGARVDVVEGKKVKAGQRLVWWDAHSIPILAEASGVVRFQDIEEGETVRIEDEKGKGKGAATAGKRYVVIEHKGEMHPRIVIEDKSGKILDFHYLPAKARIEVEEGQSVAAGLLLARQPREIIGTQDITAGLPRVTEVFEARKPKEPAAMAEISGMVELRTDKRRGKMTVIIRSESGMERDHHVPHDRHLLVHTGDYVEAGDPLTEGPLVLQDILDIRGEEALQHYLLGEVQTVYRAAGQSINDKHIEVILSQMLRKVQVDSVGDTELLPGDVVDKFVFLGENKRLAGSLKVVEPGGTSLSEGQVVARDLIEQANMDAETDGEEPAKTKRPRPATAKTLLLGITKASLQSDSFLSAASFQESTKVFTEASLGGKVDELRGLKENVILGHLIPAGTSFKPYLEMKLVRDIPEGHEEEPGRDAASEAQIADEVQKALTGRI
ncbi:MAG: DNA-directed RNA polymerase subunit beta' [Phycisphaerae bacterium]|jgi:DNA-directed RNA polymerase subunit beta'|nr:DNA-directed RNA polymerase subunit beta' [Phycisphaerae bacterium]